LKRLAGYGFAYLLTFLRAAVLVTIRRDEVRGLLLALLVELLRLELALAFLAA